MIDWEPVGHLAADMRRAQTGRPPYDPLSMLKPLYLQALYDLSDPGLEEALMDRPSFGRFCGFALDAPTPDETTIWRFQVQAGPLLEDAFVEIGRQIDKAGPVVRQGTLMDATLLASVRRPPRRSAGAGAGQAIASVGVLTRPIPITPREPRPSVTVAVRVSDRF